jgi:hypothetical protein
MLDGVDFDLSLFDDVDIAAWVSLKENRLSFRKNHGFFGGTRHGVLTWLHIIYPNMPISRPKTLKVLAFCQGKSPSSHINE